MYESFYKLHPTPFRLTPDPHFFFESDTHKRGLSYLRFAFNQQEGFVVITGAPGTGKTELMLNLIEDIPHSKVTLAKIVTSNLDADDLLDLVAASFLIDPEPLSKGSLLKKLEDYFVSQSQMGKQVLLLIDEAHNLSVKSLIELSMLSNFQIDEKPLLQCFLLGQEPLEEKLRLPELVHLKQRVIASTHLENLNPQETRDYILHRLIKSGWNNNPIIRDTAFALIHFYTKGVPRRINSMCNRILLQAFLENRNDIGADLVHQVIEELQEEVAEEHVDLDVDFSGWNETIDQPSTSNSNNNYLCNEQLLPMERVSSEKQDSDNVINIPAFTINKERAHTETETLSSESNTISSPHDQIVSLAHNIAQTSTSTEAAATQSTDTSDETSNKTSDKTSDKTTILEQTKTAQSSHQTKVAHPASSSTEEHHTTSRPSGLLDKELQFLASLNDTPSHTKIDQTQDNPDHTLEEKDSQQAGVKKVIIDESVYDDYDTTDHGIDNCYSESSTESSNEKNHWRPVATVFAILTSIGLSIYWLYDGGANIVDQTAGIKSDILASDGTLSNIKVPETTFANNLLDTRDAPDTAIPHMPIPTPAFPETRDTQLIVTAQSETEPADIQKSTKLVAVIPVGTEKKLKAQNPDTFSTTEDSSQPGKLDQQITEILEKPGIVPKTAATATNTPSIKPGKLESGISLAAIQNSTNDSERNIGSTEKEVPHSPLLGSPVAGLIDNIKPDQHTSSRLAITSIPQTNLARTSRSTRSVSHDATKTKVRSFISNDDLHNLLFNLSTAYEMGNLQQLVSTFASDIYSSDGSTRKQLENDYQKLFDITDTRRLAIRDVKWLKKDKQMLGNGDFQVQIREKGATNYTTYEGKISFLVAKESNNIVIKRLDYDYNN